MAGRQTPATSTTLLERHLEIDMSSRIYRFQRYAALAAASATLTVGAFAADTVQPANYIGLHGGVNNLSDWDATVRLGPGVSLPGAVRAKSGLHAGIFGGRQTENARFEVEYQSGRFDINAIELGTVRQDVSNSGHYQAFTFNAYRTAALSEQLTGFAGLGLGWGSVSLPQMGFTNPPCDCFAHASTSGFAWLGRIGAEYHFGPSNHVFAQFTLLGLPQPKSGGTPGVDYARQNAGSVSIGLRHTF
jgi:hypothetical protein